MEPPRISFLPAFLCGRALFVHAAHGLVHPAPRPPVIFQGLPELATKIPAEAHGWELVEVLPGPKIVSNIGKP
jgi:hypothetical protein